MRRTHRSALALAGLVTALVAASAPVAAPAAASAAAYTVTTLHFEVTVGPAGDEQTCDVVGDLYVPDDASSTNRLPAVLSTNGFGGSKDDQAGLSGLFASRGYVALSYSGLGFGGSGCEIALDAPAYDGRAAAQLIDFLGGEDGIAFRDAAHTQPVAPLETVRLDGPGDPRVGMFGGSYGGQVQYAAASVTPELDAIVPIITWNDLSYSLAPNGTDQVRLPGQQQPGVSTDTPGSVKTNWALGFSAIGATGDVTNAQPDPITSRCPNFVDFVCPALVGGAVTGVLDDASVARLREASVASYASRVRTPTLILQGQSDTLFNLDEAVATYEQLQAQGTPVKMSWIQYGHSGDPAPGEIDFDAPDPSTQHVTRRIVDWFAHYLEDSPVDTGPEFSYFRDWVDYTGDAGQAYAAATSYPVGSPTTYHLSSALAGGSLVTDRADVADGDALFTAPPGQASNGEDLDVVSGYLEKPEAPEPLQEAPGTSARWDTDPLTAPVDVVGAPVARLRVQAPTAQATQGQDVGKLVLYLKVADVAPDGSARVVRNLVAPVRVPDVSQPFTVTMPAFAHRFGTGHRIRLLVAGASPNYRGGNAAVPVRISTAADGADQTLTLPTTGQVPGSGGSTPGDGGGGGTTPGPTPDPTPDPTPSPTPGPTDPGPTDQPGSPAGPATGGGAAAAPDTAPQAAPAVSGTPAAPTTLPDTGGPAANLLAAGLLLVALGAWQVLRSRRLA